MLVLSRRDGESIVVELEDGRRIVVQIVKSSPTCVRMGFEAPRTIKILREELIDVQP